MDCSRCTFAACASSSYVGTSSASSRSVASPALERSSLALRKFVMTQFCRPLPSLAMPSPNTSSLVLAVLSARVLVLTHSFSPLTCARRSQISSSLAAVSARRAPRHPRAISSASVSRERVSSLSRRSSVSVRRNCWFSALCLACQKNAVSLSFCDRRSSSRWNSVSMTASSRSR